MNRITRLLVVAMACLVGTQAMAKEMKMLGAFPESLIFTKEMAFPFIKLVNEESGGKINISYIGPDAVGALEQLEPVQSGVFDLLFTHPAYHAGTTAVGLAIDAIAVDPTKRRESGVIDFIDNHYKSLGLKLISAPATGSKGFRYYLKDPISGLPGLKGRKIRGTVSYHPMIEALGGKGVVMGAGGVYSALQKGVIDGAAFGLVGAKDFKWYEVSGYMAEPTFGQVGLMIFMNLDRWNNLSDQERAAFERAGVKLELNSISRFDALTVQENKDLQSLGMKITYFDKSEAENFESLWSNGVWSIAEKKSTKPATMLHDLARKAGLTK